MMELFVYLERNPHMSAQDVVNEVTEVTHLGLTSWTKNKKQSFA